MDFPVRLSLKNLPGFMSQILPSKIEKIVDHITPHAFFNLHDDKIGMNEAIIALQSIKCDPIFLATKIPREIRWKLRAE